MAQTLNFAFDKTTGLYTADAVVSDDFNIHIQFQEAATVSVLRRTSGSSFALYKKYNVAMRPFAFDEDIDLIVYPKSIRITSNVNPTSAVVTVTATATEAAAVIEDMQRQIDAIRGTDKDGNVVDTTPEIDSMHDLKNFTAGHTSNETIGDAVESSIADESEINNLFTE